MEQLFPWLDPWFCMQKQHLEQLYRLSRGRKLLQHGLICTLLCPYLWPLSCCSWIQEVQKRTGRLVPVKYSTDQLISGSFCIPDRPNGVFFFLVKSQKLPKENMFCLSTSKCTFQSTTLHFLKGINIDLLCCSCNKHCFNISFELVLLNDAGTERGPAELPEKKQPKFYKIINVFLGWRQTWWIWKNQKHWSCSFFFCFFFNSFPSSSKFNKRKQIWQRWVTFLAVPSVVNQCCRALPQRKWTFLCSGGWSTAIRRSIRSDQGSRRHFDRDEDGISLLRSSHGRPADCR